MQTNFVIDRFIIGREWHPLARYQQACREIEARQNGGCTDAAKAELPRFQMWRDKLAAQLPAVLDEATLEKLEAEKWKTKFMVKAACESLSCGTVSAETLECILCLDPADRLEIFGTLRNRKKLVRWFAEFNNGQRLLGGRRPGGRARIASDARKR